MPERQEKSGNGPKVLVKSEGRASVKSNGALIKREAGSNGHKKESMGRVSANGVKTVKKEAVKREVAMPEKKESMGRVSANGVKTVKKEAVKREVASTPDKKKEASSSGAKTVVKKSVTTTKVKTIKKEEKKEKKVFTLPGQKHEVPEERDPLRIFYESLHDQIPESEMAQFWMMEHGLLGAVEAKKALEKKQKLRVNEKNGTPTKSTTSSSKAGNKSASPNGKSGTSKIAALKGKRKREYSSDEDDFIAKPPVKRKLKR